MMRDFITNLVLAAGLTCASGCALFGSSDLATQAPPLAGMNEPPALLTEPSDELERAALDPGSFTGIEVADARASLDALLQAPDGLAVSRVVENSPAVQAGIAVGDVLFSVRMLPDGSEQPLAWQAEWRQMELKSAPGTEIEVTLDRAGATRRARIQLIARWKPAERVAVARLREDQRAGIVVRGATEVEARKAGIAPGAGAVIVGLSADSPWRKADLRFEDLICAVDGERVAAPDVLIEKIRRAKSDARLDLDVLRAGASFHVSAPLSQRAQDLSEISIPLLLSYEHTRNSSETSLLLGLFKLQRTRAAWSIRLLWLFKISGGDADRLEEIHS